MSNARETIRPANVNLKKEGSFISYIYLDIQHLRLAKAYLRKIIVLLKIHSSKKFYVLCYCD